ncbi:MAG: type II secretion system F family protein [Luteimonas sp.]
MPRFHYEALNAEGASLRGTIEADSEREAARLLDRRGLAVVELRGAGAPGTEKPGRARERRMRTQDVIVAFHELATMLQSGVALAEAVASQAASAHHPRLLAAFASISTGLRRGQTFSDALDAVALPLPGYFMTLVRAGEQAGLLAQSLADGVAQLEYDEHVRGEVRQALTYPAVLVVAGMGAVLLMFTFVVPRFATLLERGADLPLLASVVLHGGMFARDYIGWIVAAVAVAAMLFARSFARAETRARWYERLERWPVVGPWRIESETAAWSKILATLLANRVPLLDALGLAQEGVRSPQRRARLDEVSRAVRAGVPLAEALEQQSALTPTGYNLVRVGERSGELPAMLRSLGRLCENAGRVRMKQFLALLEPAAILLIGGIIGVIMIGIILAITSANDIVVR